MPEETLVGRPFTFTVLVPIKEGLDKAGAASSARASVEHLLAKKDIHLAGFRIAAHDEPCPTCGRTVRSLSGLEEGELTATVTVSAPESPSLPDVFKGSQLRPLGDLREGAA